MSKYSGLLTLLQERGSVRQFLLDEPAQWHKTRSRPLLLGNNVCLAPFTRYAAAMAASGYWDSDLALFIASGGLLALSIESNVTQYYVEGEVLNALRFSPDTLVGSDNFILMGNSTAGGVDLHSMALMTALWNSPAFLTAAQRLPDLVTELLDANLFATSSRDPDNSDLLRKLLAHQLGVTGAIQPDNMLDRFASDMNKLAQDGGLTMSDLNGQPNNYNTWNNVSRALTAFAMQFYYENTANAIDPSKQLFTDLATAGGSNGIQFDMAEVSQDFASTQANSGKGGDFTNVKGYQYFLDYLNTTSTFTAAEKQLILSMLPLLRDWYVQAGAAGMDATDTQNRGAFMLGSNGSDTLTGGQGNGRMRWRNCAANDYAWRVAA